MKLEIFGQSTKKEPILRLKLAHSGDGDVTLVAVDERGDRVDRGNILTITSNGKLMRHSWINENLGLSLDGNRRIELKA